MAEKFEIQVIGHIYNDYKEKFGIPRQSGLANSVISKIVFEKDFCQKEYFEGLEKYTHLWIIWQFSETINKSISPTVRPPKLGGNKRVGVFASRSPFRPNHLGLSSVEIEKIHYDDMLGTIIYVKGADIMNGTPIIDIKPYLQYSDSHPNASNGFALNKKEKLLDVIYNKNIFSIFQKEKVDNLIEILKYDPRPSYHDDKNRVYGMSYGDYQVKFKVEDNKLIIINIENDEAK